METIQHIIVDNTLKRIGEPQFADYLCHAYCHEGYCTFERNGQAFRFEAGDCLIIFWAVKSRHFVCDKMVSRTIGNRHGLFNHPTTWLLQGCTTDKFQ